jgi:hypothetical protein
MQTSNLCTSYGDTPQPDFDSEFTNFNNSSYLKAKSIFDQTIGSTQGTCSKVPMYRIEQRNKWQSEHANLSCSVHDTNIKNFLNKDDIVNSSWSARNLNNQNILVNLMCVEMVGFQLILVHSLSSRVNL